MWGILACRQKFHKTDQRRSISYRFSFFSLYATKQEVRMAIAENLETLEKILGDNWAVAVKIFLTFCLTRRKNMKRR
jgi:hypothetical protein